VLDMLGAPPEALAARARRLARRLRAIPGLQVRIRRGESLAGGGCLPEARLPTSIVLLEHAALSAEDISRRLRTQDPAVVGRMVDRCVALDVRTIADGEVGMAADTIGRALA
ncbi:PLP-dependent aminotransferase family protein, partial [Noviherbaspirillum galbum]